MEYDPYERFKRPDFHAPTELPQWTPMGDEGESQVPDMNPFMSALKKRMSGSSMVKGDMGGDVMGKAAGGGMGGGTGGGMTSL